MPLCLLSVILPALRMGVVCDIGGGKTQRYTYIPVNRTGDHICYTIDLRKMRAHYPGWDITVSLDETIRQIVEAWQRRLPS
jgi:hypothetical protein